MAHEASFKKRFMEGLSLQLTNPKAIFFFLSIFPQFIDPAMSYGLQFVILVMTYSSLIVLIHSTYAMFAGRAKTWLTSEKGGSAMNKIGATTFVFFGCALAGAKRTV